MLLARSMRPCVLFAVLALATAACGSIPPTDVDAADAPPDVPTDTPEVEPIDAGPDAPPTPPSAVGATAGGGFTSSSGHRMHVRIAAPQPLGGAASAGHQITTGPGALPWPTP